MDFRYAHTVSDDGLSINDELFLLGGAADPWSHVKIENYPIGTRYYKTDGTVYIKKALGSNPVQKDFEILDISGGLSEQDIIALIQLHGGGVNMNEVSDIVRMPTFVVDYKDLRVNKSDHSGGNNFYKRISTPYYVDQRVTTRQSVIDIFGKGYFTGLMLPTLADDNGSNRQVTVYITIDGIETSEIFTYSNDCEKNLRLYVGGSKNLSLANSKDNNDFVTSDRRPQRFGEFIDSNDDDKVGTVIHPTVFLNDLALPRMCFDSSLKVEYQLNQSDIFENKSYKNRASVLYMIGDF